MESNQYCSSLVSPVLHMRLCDRFATVAVCACNTFRSVHVVIENANASQIHAILVVWLNVYGTSGLATFKGVHGTAWDCICKRTTYRIWVMRVRLWVWVGLSEWLCTADYWGLCKVWVGVSVWVCESEGATFILANSERERIPQTISKSTAYTLMEAYLNCV